MVDRFGSAFDSEADPGVVQKERVMNYIPFGVSAGGGVSCFGRESLLGSRHHNVRVDSEALADLVGDGDGDSALAGDVVVERTAGDADHARHVGDVASTCCDLGTKLLAHGRIETG